jgi:hypothetical protein
MSMCRDIDGSYCGYLAGDDQLFAGLSSQEVQLPLKRSVVSRPISLNQRCSCGRMSEGCASRAAAR